MDKTAKMLREIDRSAFLKTMDSGMKDITKETAPVIDIWKYAKCLLDENLISEYGFDNRLIEAVYGNEKGRYQHILLFTDKRNCYAVIVVDAVNRVLLGHHFLDLNIEYGLTMEETV